MGRQSLIHGWTPPYVGFAKSKPKVPGESYSEWKMGKEWDTCIVPGCGMSVLRGDSAIKFHNDRNHRPVDKLEPDYAELARRKGNGLSDEEAWADYEAVAESAFTDTPFAERKRIEEEAHDLVFGDRQAAYGHPSSDFTAMGRITAAILSRWLESEGYQLASNGNVLDDKGPVYFPDIPPRVVALIMTAVKLSRQSARPKRDNLVDLIGYVLCADRIEDGEPDEGK